MKLDGATIVIERRTVGGCIDLAICFYRQYAWPILSLNVVFALPVCALVYCLSMRTDAGLAWSVALFALTSPFLGAALVAGAGHRVFGDPLRVDHALDILRSRLLTLSFYVVVSRGWIALSLFFMVYTEAPGLAVLAWLFFPIAGLIAVHRGFFPEVILLERLRGARMASRSAELMRNVGFALLTRCFTIGVFGAIAVISLFILADKGAEFFLAIPILFGRVSSDVPTTVYVQEALDLLRYDPFAITALHATLWLVYPVARLAWFFCYLDVRIRKECWDVELDFRIEARRLESLP